MVRTHTNVATPTYDSALRHNDEDLQFSELEIVDHQIYPKDPGDQRARPNDLPGIKRFGFGPYPRVGYIAEEFFDSAEQGAKN